MNAAPPTRSPRLLRFSLRAMLLVFLVVGAALTWFNAESRRAGLQGEAVTSIRSLGGHCTYGWQLRNAAKGTQPGAPQRIGLNSQAGVYLRSVFGEDFLTPVERVSLHFVVGSRNELVAFRDLYGVEDIRLNSRVILDDDLRHFHSLTRLKRLDLWCKNVSDDGLKHLANLSNLEVLDLGRTQVTDDGLAHLKGLRNLRLLKVRGTGVTAEGAAAFQQLVPTCRVEGYPKPPKQP